MPLVPGQQMQMPGMPGQQQYANAMLRAQMNAGMAMKSQAFQANQQNMLRKRDPKASQAFIAGQKKLKNGREVEEKSELDDCPNITTMMFMNDFNIDVC